MQARVIWFKPVTFQTFTQSTWANSGQSFPGGGGGLPHRVNLRNFSRSFLDASSQYPGLREAQAKQALSHSSLRVPVNVAYPLCISLSVCQTGI